MCRTFRRQGIGARTIPLRVRSWVPASLGYVSLEMLGKSWVLMGRHADW